MLPVVWWQAVAFGVAGVVGGWVALVGPLDDVVVVALALRYAARRVPRDTLLAAWDGDPALLTRLLGPAVRRRRSDPGERRH
jgi:hypothetical protein